MNAPSTPPSIPPSIQCPDPECGAVSYNPNDIHYRYCGRCHRFHSDYIYAPDPDFEKQVMDAIGNTGPISPADLEAAGQEVLFPEVAEPVQFEFTGCTPIDVARRMAECPSITIRTEGLPDIDQLVSLPAGRVLTLDPGTITGTIGFSIPEGAHLSEDVFLLAMARRYQSQLGSECSTVQAMQLAVSSLEVFYDDESCKFGDAGHLWDKGAAEDIVDSDLEHWDD